VAIRDIKSKEELRSLLGQEVAISDWLIVTQERMNLFADATGDHQWIHVDTERAKRESPYGATIAHGFLTLSLLAPLMEQSVRISFPVKMMVNYGLDRVRFPSAVPAGSRIRARVTLLAIDEMPGAVQTKWNMTIEREGGEKPCCVAEWLLRYYE